MWPTAQLGLDRWHAYIAAHDPAALPDLLAENVVFESPVVFTPQRGKAITQAYLQAAAIVLGQPSFRYCGTWTNEHSAILEFTCEIEGITINGIDMIRWDEHGLISHFKVMVRPLKAVNLLHQAMAARLAGSSRAPA